MKAIERICKGTPPGVPALRYGISPPHARKHIASKIYRAAQRHIANPTRDLYRCKKVGVFCSQLALIGYLYCYAQKRENIKHSFCIHRLYQVTHIIDFESDCLSVCKHHTPCVLIILVCHNPELQGHHI